MSRNHAARRASPVSRKCAPSPECAVNATIAASGADDAAGGVAAAAVVDRARQARAAQTARGFLPPRASSRAMKISGRRDTRRRRPRRQPRPVRLRAPHASLKRIRPQLQLSIDRWPTLSPPHPSRAAQADRASLTWSGRRHQALPRARRATTRSSYETARACARTCSRRPREAASMRSSTASKPLTPP